MILNICNYVYSYYWFVIVLTWVGIWILWVLSNFQYHIRILVSTKKSSELWKSDLFFQRKWQKPSAFLLISVFFRTVFYLWFSSQSYSYHSIASCLLFKGKEAHFLGYFIVFTFDSFFQEVLLLFFSFLVFFVWKSFGFHQHQVVDFMVSHVMIMYLKLLTPKHGAVGLGDLIIRFYYTFFSFCREYHIFLLLKAATV